MPPGVSNIQVTVKATATANDDHIFPPGTRLVSGVYSVSTPHILTKPVTLEIEHCCLLKSPGDANGLVFSQCSRNEPPCQFYIIKDGKFEVDNKFGRIQLEKFSLFAILQDIWHYIFPSIRYCAGLYYSVDGTNLRQCRWHVYLVITKDIGVAKQVKLYFIRNI